MDSYCGLALITLLVTAGQVYGQACPEGSNVAKMCLPGTYSGERVLIDTASYDPAVSNCSCTFGTTSSVLKLVTYVAPNYPECNSAIRLYSSSGNSIRFQCLMSGTYLDTSQHNVGVTTFETYANEYDKNYCLVMEVAGRVGDSVTVTCSADIPTVQTTTVSNTLQSDVTSRTVSGKRKSDIVDSTDAGRNDTDGLNSTMTGRNDILDSTVTGRNDTDFSNSTDAGRNDKDVTMTARNNTDGFDITMTARNNTGGLDITMTNRNNTDALDITMTTRNNTGGLDITMTTRNNIDGLDITMTDRNNTDGLDITMTTRNNTDGLDITMTTRNSTDGLDITMSTSNDTDGLYLTMTTSNDTYVLNSTITDRKENNDTVLNNMTYVLLNETITQSTPTPESSSSVKEVSTTTEHFATTLFNSTNQEYQSETITDQATDSATLNSSANQQNESKLIGDQHYAESTILHSSRNENREPEVTSNTSHKLDVIFTSSVLDGINDVNATEQNATGEVMEFSASKDTQNTTEANSNGVLTTLFTGTVLFNGGGSGSPKTIQNIGSVLADSFVNGSQLTGTDTRSQSDISGTTLPTDISNSLIMSANASSGNSEVTATENNISETIKENYSIELPSFDPLMIAPEQNSTANSSDQNDKYTYDTHNLNNTLNLTTDYEKSSFNNNASFSFNNTNTDNSTMLNLETHSLDDFTIKMESPALLNTLAADSVSSTAVNVKELRTSPYTTHEARFVMENSEPLDIVATIPERLMKPIENTTYTMQNEFNRTEEIVNRIWNESKIGSLESTLNVSELISTPAPGFQPQVTDSMVIDVTKNGVPSLFEQSTRVNVRDNDIYTHVPSLFKSTDVTGVRDNMNEPVNNLFGGINNDLGLVIDPLPENETTTRTVPTTPGPLLERFTGVLDNTNKPVSNLVGKINNDLGLIVDPLPVDEVATGIVLTTPGPPLERFTGGSDKMIVDPLPVDELTSRIISTTPGPPLERFTGGLDNMIVDPLPVDEVTTRIVPTTPEPPLEKLAGGSDNMIIDPLPVDELTSRIVPTTPGPPLESFKGGLDNIIVDPLPVDEVTPRIVPTTPGPPLERFTGGLDNMIVDPLPVDEVTAKIVPTTPEPPLERFTGGLDNMIVDQLPVDEVTSRLVPTTPGPPPERFTGGLDNMIVDPLPVDEVTARIVPTTPGSPLERFSSGSDNMIFDPLPVDEVTTKIVPTTHGLPLQGFTGISDKMNEPVSNSFGGVNNNQGLIVEPSQVNEATTKLVATTPSTLEVMYKEPENPDTAFQNADVHIKGYLDTSTYSPESKISAFDNIVTDTGLDKRSNFETTTYYTPVENKFDYGSNVDLTNYLSPMVSDTNVKETTARLPPGIDERTVQNESFRFRESVPTIEVNATDSTSSLMGLRDPSYQDKLSFYRETSITTTQNIKTQTDNLLTVEHGGNTASSAAVNLIHSGPDFVDHGAFGFGETTPLPDVSSDATPVLIGREVNHLSFVHRLSEPLSDVYVADPTSGTVTETVKQNITENIRSLSDAISSDASPVLSGREVDHLTFVHRFSEPVPEVNMTYLALDTVTDIVTEKVPTLPEVISSEATPLLNGKEANHLTFVHRLSEPVPEINTTVVPENVPSFTAVISSEATPLPSGKEINHFAFVNRLSEHVPEVNSTDPTPEGVTEIATQNITENFDHFSFVHPEDVHLPEGASKVIPEISTVSTDLSTPSDSVTVIEQSTVSDKITGEYIVDGSNDKHYVDTATETVLSSDTFKEVTTHRSIDQTTQDIPITASISGNEVSSEKVMVIKESMQSTTEVAPAPTETVMQDMTTDIGTDTIAEKSTTSTETFPVFTEEVMVQENVPNELAVPEIKDYKSSTEANVPLDILSNIEKQIIPEIKPDLSAPVAEKSTSIATPIEQSTLSATELNSLIVEQTTQEAMSSIPKLTVTKQNDAVTNEIAPEPIIPKRPAPVDGNMNLPTTPRQSFNMIDEAVVVSDTTDPTNTKKDRAGDSGMNVYFDTGSSKSSAFDMNNDTYIIVVGAIIGLVVLAVVIGIFCHNGRKRRSEKVNISGGNNPEAVHQNQAFDNEAANTEQGTSVIQNGGEQSPESPELNGSTSAKAEDQLNGNVVL